MRIKKLRNCFLILLLVFVFGASITYSFNTYATTGVDRHFNGINNILFYSGLSGSNQNCVISSNSVSHSGTTQACGDTAEDVVWSALLSAGFSDEAAAGILGNLWHEITETLNPLIHEQSYQQKGAAGGCWNPTKNADGTGSCKTTHGDPRSWNNIVLDENGHWDLMKNADYNLKQSYGIGLIQFSYAWRVRLLEYIEAHAPNVLHYFYEPEKYGNYGISGNQVLQEIGKDDFATLVSVQIEEILQDENSKQYCDQLKNLNEGTPEDNVKKAAEIWSTKVEQCSSCHSGGEQYNTRINSAMKAYEKMKGKRPCGETTTTSTNFSNGNAQTTVSSSTAGMSSGSGSTSVSSVSAAGGIAGLHAPQNPWLDKAGLEGFELMKALNSTVDKGYHVDTSAMVEGRDEYTSFATDGAGKGLPAFIVLHWTAGDNFSDLNAYKRNDGNYYCPPHFTIDTVKKKIYQHFPLSSPSAAVAAGSDGTAWDRYGIQIEVVGQGGTKPEYNIYNFTEEQWEYLGKLLIAISGETGIPLTSSLKWGEKENERTILDPAGMKQYVGVMGHIHVDGRRGSNPTNAYNKTDPGKMWYLLEPVIKKSGYTYTPAAGGVSGIDCVSSSSSSGDIYKGAQYTFTDDQLKRLWWAASAEQGSVFGRKTELSIFANLFERDKKNPGDNQGLIDYVTYRYFHPGNGWFACATGMAYTKGRVSTDECPNSWNGTFKEPTAEEIGYVRDVLNNGNRVIAPEIDEHDSINDITSVSNNGESFEPGEKSKYISGVTVIKNRMGSTYTFYQWANGSKQCTESSSACGDPFGYKGNAPSSGSSSVASSSCASSCGSSYSSGTCFSLAAEDGGCTSDGYTYYWQGGPSWGGTSISSSCKSTIGSSGCGYASTAMVVTALTGKQVTPLDTFNVAKSITASAFYACGSGTNSTIAPEVIKAGNYGLKVDSYNSNQDFTEENISNLLRQGKMILLTVGAETGDATFTGGAHWIAIRGIASSGKWKVFSSSRTPDDKVNDTEFDPAVVIKTHINHRSYWHVVYK